MALQRGAGRRSLAPTGVSKTGWDLPVSPNLVDFEAPGEYDDGCSWVGRSPSRPADTGARNWSGPPTAPLREGELKMDLLSRHAKLALLLLVLFALTSCPGIWTSHHSVSWIAAAPAWAGSPDETLHPPPNPPPGRAAALSGFEMTSRGATTGIVTPTRPDRGLTRLERLAIVWRLYLGHALRF